MTLLADTSSRLLAALERGESLPARWYTDPGITEREIAQVFRKSWNYIGPLSQLVEIGDYVTVDVHAFKTRLLRRRARRRGAQREWPCRLRERLPPSPA